MLVGLTQKNLVALSTTDGERLKIKFVRSEEYYENMQKFLEIEEMKKEVEKIGQKIKNGIYELVKAELESRGEDPAIRPYVKGAVKEVITERYQKEVERISEEALQESFGRVILSLSGFKEGTEAKDRSVTGFVRVVYLDDFGKTGEDVMWPDKILRLFLEGKEVEGLYNYYDSCEALKAIILYYLNKKPPILPVLRKTGEIKILKGEFFYQNSDQLKQ